MPNPQVIGLSEQDQLLATVRAKLPASGIDSRQFPGLLTTGRGKL